MKGRQQQTNKQTNKQPLPSPSKTATEVCGAGPRIQLEGFGTILYVSMFVRRDTRPIRVAQCMYGLQSPRACLSWLRRLKAQCRWELTTLQTEFLLCIALRKEGCSDTVKVKKHIP
jgi:hypothetical protein